MEVFSPDAKKTSPSQTIGQTHEGAVLPFQVCDVLPS